jgi:hypothetical protein
MESICVIAFTSMKLLFPHCPVGPVAETMKCTVQRISPYAPYHAICIDPVSKEIVYDHKVYEMKSA